MKCNLIQISLLVAVLTALPIVANAQLTFVTNNGSITITGYTGNPTIVNIPGTTNGYPVTSIALQAFQNKTVTSVTIPDSVTNIGGSAFFNCVNLTNVTLGNGVITIGNSAFNSCTALNNITLPNSLKILGLGAFNFCTSLNNVTIPNSISSIGTTAFYHCSSLVSVSIPDSVTNIGTSAFYTCSKLARATIGSNVVSISSYALAYCTNLGGIYFKGNAPTADSTVCTNDSKAIVYYLPGTTGWGATFAGIPTALWLPQAQTTDNGFGVRTNQFGFNINWASGQTVVVEASTNLSKLAWQPVQTNPFTSDSFYFSDPQWANYPSRFYRLRSP